VRVAIVTSNYNPNGTVTNGHGMAWAQMVNDVANWVIANRYSSQVDVAGGTDIELLWSQPATAQAWVDGYASVAAHRFLYVLGSLEGCPNCDNGWTLESAWSVSWHSPPALPLPQIYQSVNARQWANLALYAAQQHNETLIFAGALTEYQACLGDPTDATCQPPTQPATGWQYLFDQLNANPATQQTLPWSTDLAWLN
jgi:hypothetical protein